MLLSNDIEVMYYLCLSGNNMLHFFHAERNGKFRDCGKRVTSFCLYVLPLCHTKRYF